MSAQPTPSFEELDTQLSDEIGELCHSPLDFAGYVWDWGMAELDDSAGPRKWQAGILDQIGSHLTNPETRFQPCRIAVSSGKGIGKSALVSMLICWAISTCEDTKVLVTANTGTQLATKTVPEVAKWFRLSVNSHWWDVNALSIRVKDPKHQATWRADFIPWNAENTEAFQGLHNKGKRIVVIFDEASGIDDVIWEVTEGALTDENTEIIWVAFGNPTRNTGRFKECFGRFKHRWYTQQIDARTVEGTNAAVHQQWIDDYGEDSDFVRVWVKGEFPRAGSNQFIDSESVANARRYQSQGHERLPKVLSVDVARFGDDQTVIGDRQGRKARILKKLRGQDTVQVAERVIEIIDIEAATGMPYDAVVVDGDGLGAGVIDQIKHRGYGDKLFEFHGGERANDADAYFNRRAEVWGVMRDWLRAGAEIPDDPELAVDLEAPQYGFSNKQQIQLERKQDMKARGLASPDCGDMLAMTFGVHVAAPKPLPPPAYRYPGQSQQEWMG